MAYALWIILSTVTHYIALNNLDPLTYITMKKETAQWGLWYLKRISFVYLLYPLLFIAAVYLFKSNPYSHKMLCLIPVLVLPSLFIGIYQKIINIYYLNDLFFAGINQVSGLEIDANGFGISLFLIFPLAALAILTNRSIWNKLFFSMLGGIIIWCLLLSGNRTAFLGVVIFIIILPWIWFKANTITSKKKYYLLLIYPLVLLLLTGSIGFLSVRKDFSSIDYVIHESQRQELGLQAYRLTKISQLSGWGPGGFYRNLHNIRFRNGKTHWNYDNANNHYLQMSSELGLLGLFSNVFLHLLPLWMVLRIRKQIQDRDERVATGIVLTTVTIMMLLYLTGPHTLSFSVMWSMVVLQSFLIATALKHGYTLKKLNPKMLLFVVLFLTAVFLWGTYDNAFGREGYKARQKADWWPFKYEKNCYPDEKWKEGYVRWCKNDAFLQKFLYIDDDKKLNRLKLAFKVYHPDVQEKPVTVEFGGKSGPVNSVILGDHLWKEIEIPFTDEYKYSFVSPSRRKEWYFVLSLDVSRTWVPKDWGVNNDQRELGVAVLLNDKHFKDKWWSNIYEKNCYSEETWEEGEMRWCKKDAFLQIPLITDEEKNIKEFKFTFKLNHPDIQLNPVTLSYGGKAGTLHESVINSNAWNFFTIPVTGEYIFEFEPMGDRKRRYFILSLDVSRTWVPKEWGVNDDPRELGAAVLLRDKHVISEHFRKTVD
jgi:O-antigen ligase